MYLFIAFSDEMPDGLIRIDAFICLTLRDIVTARRSKDANKRVSDN